MIRRENYSGKQAEESKTLENYDSEMDSAARNSEAAKAEQENQKEEILNFFCAQNKKGLLAEVDEKEIYYFPDLNYQDAYLIKYLLENKCSINSSLKIISGNNVV